MTGLIEAIRNGEIKEVSRLIDAGADVDQATEGGATLLFLAAKNGHVAIVEMLLGRGADVNLADKLDQAPLYWAARKGHLAVVEALLAADAEVNLVNKKGDTPLSIATERGHTEIVGLLEKERAIDLYNECNNYDGNSELKQQVFNEAVRLKDYFVEHILELAEKLDNNNDAINLLANSIAVDESSSSFMPSNHVSEVIHTSRSSLSRGYNPNTNSAKKIRDEITRLESSMENEIEEDEVKENGTETIATSLISSNRLIDAAKEGDIEKVLSLIDAGADVNQADILGSTPLHWAANNGHVAIVEMLLGHDDIDVNQTNDKGSTPLYWAAREGHVEVVEVLLEANADVNQADSFFGLTPLYWAADKGHMDIVRMLLAHEDIDVNQADKNGWTPLYSAARRGHEAVVEMLLAREDIDVNQVDEFGSPPLYIAACYGHEGIVRALLAREDTNVNLADKNRKTPLFLAAKNGHVEVVRALLERQDVNVNLADVLGWTPLYWAARQGHNAIVEMLLEYGVDVNQANKYGNTPLYCAVLKGHQEIVRLLLERGAEVNQANQYGWIPLNVATEKGNTKIVNLLEKKSAISLRVIYLYNQCRKHDEENTELEKKLFNDAVQLKDYFVEHILELAEELKDDDAINLLENSIAGNNSFSSFMPSNDISKVIHRSRGIFSSGYNPDTNSAEKIRNDLAILRLSMDDGIEEEDEEKENITDSNTTSLTFFGGLLELPPEYNINDIELSEVVDPGLGNNEIVISRSNGCG